MSVPGVRSVRRAHIYPVHFTLLVVLGRAGEGNLVHGGKRDCVRVIAAEDECVLVGSGLAVRSWDAGGNVRWEP